MSEPIDWNELESVELEEPWFRRDGDYRRSGRDGPPFVLDPTGATTKAGKVRSLRYGRPSGFHRWIDNAYNLERWSERMVLVGTALLMREVLDADLEDPKVCDVLIARAKHVAGADAAAERGTAAHEATHRLHDAERAELDVLEVLPELGYTAELVEAILEAYAEALRRWGLEVLASEIKIVDDRWRLAGTADRFVRITRDLWFGGYCLEAGTVVVLDLKTGALRVRNGEPIYWLGYAIQLRSYAHGVRYVIEDGHERREPLEWPVDVSVGLILHLDIAGALETDVVTASLWLVDLEAGFAAGELAVAARTFASTTGIFGQLVEGPIAQTVAVPGPSRLELELEESLLALGVQPPERAVGAPESEPTLREWLQGRIDVLGAHTAARRELELRWPTGIAPLRSSDAHTDEELEAIERLLDRLEADHSIPFGPSRPGRTDPPSGWLERLLGTFPNTTIHETREVRP